MTSFAVTRIHYTKFYMGTLDRNWIMETFRKPTSEFPPAFLADSLKYFDFCFIAIDLSILAKTPHLCRDLSSGLSASAARSRLWMVLYLCQILYKGGGEALVVGSIFLPCLDVCPAASKQNFEILASKYECVVFINSASF